ncbi:MAG: hypothetical protein HZC37_10095 [Burkholderiales bacterium]|nr:hypothetical protein [Burkholderiales bacterium]
MTVDAVLVLQRSDVVRMAATPARYAGTRLLFVDPGLLDDAAQRGLTLASPYEYRRLDLGADMQARAASEAIARATLVDLQMSAERERLWGGDQVLTGWDVGLFFLALQRAAVARAIAKAVSASFKEQSIGLLRPSNPQQMYFDSFVSADLVGQDPQRFSVIDRYHDARWQRADAYDQVLDAHAMGSLLARGVITLVSHVPTCFYDRAWLAEEVARSHAYTLDLPSPFWDVPLHRGAPLLVPRSNLAAEAEVADYGARAVRVLEPLLADLLPQQRAREEQIGAWAARARWQALNFLQLRAAFARLPASLRSGAAAAPDFLIADQDTGLNGPLFSIADKVGGAITVVPHSGHASMLLPHGRRAQVVERAGYGCAPRTLLGQAVPARAVRFNQQAQRRPAAAHGVRLARLCLLLNSLSTEGLSHVDAYALAEFYKPLAALCETAGVQLVLRPKPGAPAMAVLAGALGLAPTQLAGAVQQPLPTLAETCELCLAWGEPTTGIAPFLDAGSLVLQVMSERWPVDYLVCMPLVRDGVVPTLAPAEALAAVHRYIGNGAALAADTRMQSAAFDARAAGAHDHLFERALHPVQRVAA